jgi:hypothetical protein
MYAALLLFSLASISLGGIVTLTYGDALVLPLEGSSTVHYSPGKVASWVVEEPIITYQYHRGEEEGQDWIIGTRLRYNLRPLYDANMVPHGARLNLTLLTHARLDYGFGFAIMGETSRYVVTVATEAGETSTFRYESLVEDWNADPDVTGPVIDAYNSGKMTITFLIEPDGVSASNGGPNMAWFENQSTSRRWNRPSLVVRAKSKPPVSKEELR